jgi:hypothetical protein
MMTRTVALFLAVGGLCAIIAGCDEPQAPSTSTTRQSGKNRTYQDITLDVLAAISDKDAQKLSSLSDSQTAFHSGHNPDTLVGGHIGNPNATPQEFLDSFQWQPTFEKDRTQYKEQADRVEATARGYDGARAIEVKIFFARSQDGNWRISMISLANRL